MKKVLCSVLVAATLVFAEAQTKIALQREAQTVSKKSLLKDPKRNHDLNRAKLFSGNLPGKVGGVPAKITSKTVSPDASIYTELWGEVQSAGHDEKLLFQLNYSYGANAELNVKLLDGQIDVVKSFTVALPESANNFALLNDFFYDEEGLRNFLIYVHHFEGNGGPESQLDDIFVVNENGDLRKVISGYSAKVVQAAGGARLMAIHDTNDEMQIKTYALDDFSEDKSMSIPFELINFMSGSPVNFMEVKGVPSLVLAHYKKLFIDNDTFEVFPDNNLMVKIYDFDLNLKKSVALDITTAYPEDEFTIPMAEFGMFYGYGKYDITDHTFNDDENIEILYSISYFDLLGDKEWNHYFVGDEDGNRIRSLEKEIIGNTQLQELPGKDDQIGLYIGEDDFVSGLEMFDIQSWTTAHTFPAFYNGELLSLNFNRVPAGDSYDYLFGMPELELVAENAYGRINHYDSEGQFKKTTRLFLGENATNFTPLLYSEALTPNLYFNDGQPVYAYASKHMTNGMGYNIFRIARNETDIVLETQGDQNKGNVVGSRFITDLNGDISKLALLYTSGDDNLTIDFYNLPFSILSTGSADLKNNFLVFVDNGTQSVRWNQKSENFAVYSMSGNLVKKGTRADSFSAAGLPHGVYLLTITTAKGETLTKRFIL